MSADSFHVRRVVVGRDENGAAAIVSDGSPPQTISAPTGFGVSELLSSSGPLLSAEDGGDPPREGVGAFPANGGVAARLIRFPATDEWVRIPGDDQDQPGMHRSETLDLMVVLSGRIVLGVEDGEAEIGAGDAVIQRGTLHRWRVTGDEPCAYLSVLLAPSVGAPVTSPPLPALHAGTGPQLFVTGAGAHGSTVEASGTSAPAEDGRRRWWDTGGPVRTVNQGGAGNGTSQGGASGAISLTAVDLAVAAARGYATNLGSVELVSVLSGTVTATEAVLDEAAPADPEPTTPMPPKPPEAAAAPREARPLSLSLTEGEVLISRDVALRLTSDSAQLSVVSFTPAAS